MQQNRQNESWIDVVKCLAAGGVMVQHVNSVLYTDQRVADSVQWVVAAFLILGGYNTMSSWERNKKINVGKKLLKMFVPYMISTCIYVVWQNRFFNVEIVWQKLLHFNAVGPLYFVAVYMQLVVVSPFLIGCIRWAEEKCRFVRHFCVLMLIVFCSYFSVHYTDILGIALGGGNLFSGFWLIFWYGGMVFFVKKREETVRLKRSVSIALLIICLLWEYIFVFKDYNSIFRNIYGNMYGMTSVKMTWCNAIQAFLITFFFKEVIELLEMQDRKIIIHCLKPICYIGRMSLYIFLYHILLRDIYYEYFFMEVFGWEEWHALYLW